MRARANAMGSTQRAARLRSATHARRRPRSGHERRHPDRDDARQPAALRAHDRGDARAGRAGAGPPDPRRGERLRSGLDRARGARRRRGRRRTVGAHDGLGEARVREGERAHPELGARLVRRAALRLEELRRGDLQGRHRPLRPPGTRDRRDGARHPAGRPRGARDRELRLARVSPRARAGHARGTRGAAPHRAAGAVTTTCRRITSRATTSA